MRIRADLFITFLVSALLSLGAAEMFEHFAEKHNEAEWEKPVWTEATDGSIGAVATNDIPRLSTASLEEIKNADGKFTIELETTMDLDSISMDWDSRNFRFIRMDSGELIFAKVNLASITSGARIDNFRYEKDIMPIGVVIHEAPPIDNLAAIIKAKEKHGTVIADYYIDMQGMNMPYEHKKKIDTKGLSSLTGLSVCITVWFLIRFITVRAGICPPMLSKRDKMILQGKHPHDD